jgi:hypothetical protein
MKDIDRSIAVVAEQALAIAGREPAVYLSFDLDVCDPSIAPGVARRSRAARLSGSAHGDGNVADSGLLRALIRRGEPHLDDRNMTAISARNWPPQRSGKRSSELLIVDF